MNSTDNFIRIQNIILPNPELKAPKELYLRLSEQAFFSYEQKKIYLAKYSKVSFDTFFNGFTVDKWKDKTGLDNLFLTLEGEGNLLLKFYLIKPYNNIKKSSSTLTISYVTEFVREYNISFNRKNSLNIELDFFNNLSGGILFFELKALEDSEIHDVYYSTRTNDIKFKKLAIIITHYNRQNFVLSAIERLKNEIFSDSFFSERISIIIIDNSKNIGLQTDNNLIVINNENYGGSGGFVKGLLYAKEKNYDYCLFMDDDASCEIESIKRAYIFMLLSTKDDLAIGGVLLSEQNKSLLWEKGAVFNGLCNPLHHKQKATNRRNLLLFESNLFIPNYCAWWFFMFNIKHIKYFPFPFFVRGDDILFSLMNRFDLLTLNGIACWGEEFGLKHNPVSIYLDLRSLLILNLAYSRTNFLSSIIIILKFWASTILSYNYESSYAVKLAVKHILLGKDFWSKNLDASKIIKEINRNVELERLREIDFKTLEEYIIFEDKKLSKKDSLIRKIARVFFLNNYLLPSFLFRKGICLQEKSFMGNPKTIFRYKKILYYNSNIKKGYITTINKKRALYEFTSLIVLLLKFTFKFRSLKKELKTALEEFTKYEFWKNLYK